MAGNILAYDQDLQSILATLAQYAPPAAPETTVAELPGGSSATPVPEDALRSDELVQDTATTNCFPPRTQDPRLRPQGRSAASPKPLVDPASITTWQEGLRCVTKIAAANAQFAVSIKRMMRDQRANEMRWYMERQNLKQTQANRSTSAAKAQSILKSLNTSFYDEPSMTENLEVNKATELAQFDGKIYSAQLSMEAAMSVELKSLGVPFFGTDEKLVVAQESTVPQETLLEGRPKWSPIVTESQLLELRRKMITHLEDLYRD